MTLLVLWAAIFQLLSTSVCVKAADVVMMDADREMRDDAANCIPAVASPSLQSQDMDIDVSGSLVASQSSGAVEGQADAGSCASQNHEEMEVGGDDHQVDVYSSTLEMKDVCSQESAGYAEAEITLGTTNVPKEETVLSFAPVENEDPDTSGKDALLPLPAAVYSFQSSTASDISASQSTTADPGSDSQSTNVADTSKSRRNEATSSVTPVQPCLVMSDVAGDITPNVKIAEKDMVCKQAGNVAPECEKTADVVTEFETPEKSAADDSAADKDELLINHPAEDSSIARSDPDPGCAGATCASSKVLDEDADATENSKLQDDGITDTQKLTSTGRVRTLKTTPKDAKAENDHWVDHEQLQWELEPLCGFAFNEKGELRDKKGNPFVFEVSANHRQNQLRYERLGEAITEEIYKLLEERCHLKRIYLPLGVEDVEKPSAGDETVNTGQGGAGEPDQLEKPECAGEVRGATPTSVDVGVVGDRGDEIKPRRPTQINKPHSFIFVSDNWATADRLLILIHGSGVVRAGQWARRLIINDDLEKGTQMPYIERALQEGYGVVVLNTNLNRWPDVSDYNVADNIPENKTPESHALYVWRKLISSEAKAQHIAIVAHSYGGIVTKHLVTEELEECQKRVFAVAFTDSVHGFGYFTDTDPKHTEKVQEFFAKRTRNWVTSDKPRDEPMPSYGNRVDSPRISAGHTKHEWTSYASFDSVFKFFEESYQKRLQAGDDGKRSSSPDEKKTTAEKIPCPNL